MSYIYQGEKMPEMGRGNRQVTLKICLGKNNPYILNSKVYENFSLLYILDIIFFQVGFPKLLPSWCCTRCVLLNKLLFIFYLAQLLIKL